MGQSSTPPVPDYELTDPPRRGEADTVRTTYRIGGQIVAVQTKMDALIIRALFLL